MKIAICVPYYGDVKARFFQSMANAISVTMKARINWRGTFTAPVVKTFIAGTCSIDTNRNLLVQAALAWGADYIMFADTDMTFPPEAITALLAADKPVVGCDYARRDGSQGNAAVTSSSGLERITYMGLGLCLLNARILDDLKGPWFRTTIGENGQIEEGEDGYFFAMLSRRGVPVFVHHDLSAKVGHIAEREIMLADVESSNANTILPAAGAG